MDEGWIKLHRAIIKKPIWKCSTPEQKVILITLLLMVNHEAAEWVWQGRKFYIKPGQCITSASSIIKECGSGISRQNIRTALDKFEKYEFLTMQSTKTGMLITIVNWGLYQSMGEIQPRFQPRGNQEVTTNKKDNNKKKVCIDHFDNFWSAYPRKVSRAEVLLISSFVHRLLTMVADSCSLILPRSTLYRAQYRGLHCALSF